MTDLRLLRGKSLDTHVNLLNDLRPSRAYFGYRSSPPSFRVLTLLNITILNFTILYAIVKIAKELQLS